jgi:iron complex outermembrane recepter protein
MSRTPSRFISPARYVPSAFSIATALALAVSATSPTASAQSVAPDTVVLNEFVVTGDTDRGYRASNSISATRIATPIKDLPFTVSAFTEEFIQDISARELNDVVRFSASVTNAAREFSQGNAKFNIRGFDSDPQRNGFIGAGYVDTATVQRVEVAKGPASLLYGQLAPGGVVNYITKTPTPQPRISLTAQAGSYEFYRTVLDVNQPLIGETLLLRVIGAYETAHEWVDYHKGYARTFAPMMLWRPYEGTSVLLEYQNYKRFHRPQAFMLPNVRVPLSNAALYPAVNGQRFPVDYFGPVVPLGRTTNLSEPNDYRKQRDDTARLEIQQRLGNNWNARAAGAYTAGAFDRRQHGFGDAETTIPAALLTGLSRDPAVYLQQVGDYLNFERDGLVSLRRIQRDQGKSWNRDFQADLAGRYEWENLRWRPLVGYNYRNSSSRSRLDTLPRPQWAPNWNLLDRSTWTFSDIPNENLPAGNVNRGSSTQHGIYSTHQFTALEDRLLAVAGARWSTAKGGAFKTTKTTPQVGAGYRFIPSLMAYVSYSESFQAQNRLLRIRGVPTEQARPFLGTGREAGLKMDSADGRFSGTLAVFSVTQDNYIFLFNEIDPNDGLTKQSDLQNSSVKTEGIELELVYSPTQNWQILFSASLNDPVYDKVTSNATNQAFLEGTQIESSAKELANLWTRYNFSEGNLSGWWIGGGFNYTGGKALISNNPYLQWPDRIVVDAAIGYTGNFAGRPVSANLMLKNLTDEDDTPSVRSRGLPRRLVLSVTTDF